MKHQWHLVTVAIVCCMISACSGSSPQSAADGYCKCAKPVLAETEKMMAAMNSGDMSQLQQMTQQMQPKMQELQSCMEKLKEKYKDKENDTEFKNRVMAAIEKQCPSPFQRMMSSARP